MAKKTTTYTVRIGERSTRVLVPNDSTYDDLQALIDGGRSMYRVDTPQCPVNEHAANTIAFFRAIKKMFGASAYWWGDIGPSGYGQVCKPSKYGRSDCLTGRVGIKVVADSEFPVDTEGRRKYFEFRADIDKRSHDVE